MDNRVKCNWKQCIHGMAVAHTEGGGCYDGDPYNGDCLGFITNEGWEKKMREKEGVFWMVWKEWRGAAPTKKHFTFNEALEEAIRLSEKEGVTFYVLKAVEIIEKIPGPIVHRPLKEVDNGN